MNVCRLERLAGRHLGLSIRFAGRDSRHYCIASLPYRRSWRFKRDIWRSACDIERRLPSGPQLAKLAAAVFPRDPQLAAQLAQAAGATLQQLGLVPASPAPAPPMAKPPHLVDTVVCAAAEALGVPPPAVRPALLAAFQRAREVGLTTEDVEQAISAALQTAKR